MLAGVIQIHVHLACIGVAELSDLEINDDQTFEQAMEEQQIDTKPVIIQPQTPLSSEKGKIVAKFYQKICQMPD